VLFRLAYLGVTHTLALMGLLLVSNRDKDAEILALRHQITVPERHQHGEKIRFTPADRALLAALRHRLPPPSGYRERLAATSAARTDHRYRHAHASAHPPTRSARRSPRRIRTRRLSCTDEIVGAHSGRERICRPASHVAAAAGKGPARKPRVAQPGSINPHKFLTQRTSSAKSAPLRPPRGEGAQPMEPSHTMVEPD
jgi:hypothetical protein